MQAEELYRVLLRIVFAAAGVFLLLWFLNAIILIVLFLLLAVIFAMALNPPVTWLTQHKVPRWAAALLVALGVLLLFGALLWLVVPRVLTQGTQLVQSAPGYATSLANRIGNRLSV